MVSDPRLWHARAHASLESQRLLACVESDCVYAVLGAWLTDARTASALVRLLDALPVVRVLTRL